MTSTIDTPLIENLQDAERSIRETFNIDTAKVPEYKPNSAKTFMLRFSRKDENGQPTESPSQAHWRVALNVASVTVLYVDGAEWVEGDAEPAEINIKELDFPFRTIARQYNWNLRNGRKLKEFTALVNNGLDAWIVKTERYYNELLATVAFSPNSPTWTGAGTPLGQLAACFVLPIADSLIAGESSIMQTLTDAVAIQKTGGGNGFSFGRLRPLKSRVKTSMGEATGPVGFLRMYNGNFEEIRQGGSRRGANMGVLPVYHPDVIQFINSKIIEGQIANFNISVALTDDFMKAVETNAPWKFHFEGKYFDVEWKGETVSSVPAKELFDLIVTNAHVIGDPGALFIDAANRYNPQPYWYTLESTNPCGEQWLGPYENCCLGSIAVSHFVRPDGTFDWAGYQSVIELATEFLDDVVDANAYVEAVPQLETAAQGGRRIGLGLMGLADTLILLGARYGAADGLDLASQLTEYMRFHSMRASVRRAEERGAFPRIEHSIYDPSLIKELGEGAEYSGTMQDGATPYTGITWARPVQKFAAGSDFGRPMVNWDEVTEGIMAHGIRNCAQTTFAPTGTIATVAGLEGYGCEPVFALAYTRKVMQEGENIILIYLSDLFDAALAKANLSDETIQIIKEKVLANGSCQHVEEIPEDIRRIFVVAADVTPMDHVKMQAALQVYIDNSMSKTINLSYEATVDDVEEVYREAWRLGCKGITIYRQGSRDLEVLTVSSQDKTEEVEVIGIDHWPFIKPLPIPDEAEDEGILSRTHTVITPLGKVRATVTFHPMYPGRPFDMSASIGKTGSDLSPDAEAIGRLISIALRAGVQASEIADQLIGIGGFTREETLRPGRSRSMPDAIGKLLLRYANGMITTVSAEVMEVVVSKADEGTIVAVAKDDVHATNASPNELCPKCNQYTMVMLEGCGTCIELYGGCGYSKCV